MKFTFTKEIHTHTSLSIEQTRKSREKTEMGAKKRRIYPELKKCATYSQQREENNNIEQKNNNNKTTNRIFERDKQKKAMKSREEKNNRNRNTNKSQIHSCHFLSLTLSPARFSSSCVFKK